MPTDNEAADALDVTAAPEGATVLASATRNELIFKVADELHARGVRPTNANIQATVGGSYRDISPALRLWKTRNALTSPPPSGQTVTPEDLRTAGIDFIENVWAKAMFIAEERLTNDRTAMGIRMDDARTEAEQNAAAADEAQRAADEAKAALSTLQESYSKLQKSHDKACASHTKEMADANSALANANAQLAILREDKDKLMSILEERANRPQPEAAKKSKASA